jgi:hypothetical protein
LNPLALKYPFGLRPKHPFGYAPNIRSAAPNTVQAEVSKPSLEPHYPFRLSLSKPSLTGASPSIPQGERGKLNLVELKPDIRSRCTLNIRPATPKHRSG